MVITFDVQSAFNKIVRILSKNDIAFGSDAVSEAERLIEKALPIDYIDTKRIFDYLSAKRFDPKTCWELSAVLIELNSEMKDVGYVVRTCVYRRFDKFVDIECENVHVQLPVKWLEEYKNEGGSVGIETERLFRKYQEDRGIFGGKLVVFSRM